MTAKNLWQQVEQSFQEKNNIALLNTLLKMDLFPIKDSYTAYLKRDTASISRNPIPLIDYAEGYMKWV
jgi:hypothetical protein